MALYDIIDEIAGKQQTKTDTGDPRSYGAMIGIVAKNYDKDLKGRVCVSIPTRDNEANELKWVRVAYPSGGKTWGQYFLPEVGDQVLLVFENGNIEKPYIIGCVSKDGDKFLSGSVDADNQFKRIVTKNGNMIKFEDNKEGEGDKDKITITTAKSAHTVLMDNEKKLISITDNKGENKIDMKTEDGVIDIKAKSRLTIKVGDNISLILNGESGGVKLECSDLTISASQKMSVKTDGMLKVEGAQVSSKASSMYKLESGGMVSITGSPIKVG
jgi:uncharacterized protein involved in type VI secretion and phage assembly